MATNPKQIDVDVAVHPTVDSVSQLTDSRLQPLTERQIDTLMRPIKESRVKRNRAGFSYVEAWDVKAALIRVFGFGGFSADVIEWNELARDHVPQRVKPGQKPADPPKMNWQITVAVTLRLTIHQTGATYTEVATGTSSQPELGASFDMAVKSAESYALKRAAIQLGTQFGLSLYDGTFKDVVRVVVAPGQERNVPPMRTEEEKAVAQEKIDNAFSVQNSDVIQGSHEDRLVEDQDLRDAVEDSQSEDSSGN